jgi:ribosomal protein L37AE/L43A
VSDTTNRDLRNERNGSVACAECGSQHVRPSGSTYPKDRERNPDGRAAFWRCSECGARFLGPLVPERKRRRHRSHLGDRIDQSVSFGRTVKRWAFPLVVIVTTILLVGFILDRRNRDVRPPLIQTPTRP